MMAAKATRIDDVSSSLSYIGEAAVGSGESDPVWRILMSLCTLLMGADCH